MRREYVQSIKRYHNVNILVDESKKPITCELRAFIRSRI
jgi:hypothetical protein